MKTWVLLVSDEAKTMNEVSLYSSYGKYAAKAKPKEGV